ncbi:MAG: hypothetical protein ACXADL_17125 [Candidatus Thorarchaeota archaeon]|jgi:energy-coupling factor transport system substrate-specific component
MTEQTTDATTEEATAPSEDLPKRSLAEKFQMQNSEMRGWTLFISILGAVLYAAISMIPMPYTTISLIKLGFLPSLAIICAVGAIRGPIAGFLTGYLGEVVYGLVSYSVIVTYTLPAVAYGIMGFIVGLATYDFTNGRSLGKLSIISSIGFVFTTLLVVVIGFTIEGYAILAALGLQLLPLLTSGIPTVILLTPIFTRLWYLARSKLFPELEPVAEE